MRISMIYQVIFGGLVQWTRALNGFAIESGTGVVYNYETWGIWKLYSDEK